MQFDVVFIAPFSPEGDIGSWFITLHNSFYELFYSFFSHHTFPWSLPFQILSIWIKYLALHLGTSAYVVANIVTIPQQSTLSTFLYHVFPILVCDMVHKNIRFLDKFEKEVMIYNLNCDSTCLLRSQQDELTLYIRVGQVSNV